MKTLLLIGLWMITWTNVWGQTYSGNVIDSFDKKYLEGVEIKLKGESLTKTNNRGYFLITANRGDTLTISFPGFLDKKVVLGSDRFLLLEIQDRARLLPTFQVNAEPYLFRFKDGKLTLIENEIEEEKPFAQQTVGGSDKYSLVPNFSIYGPISYFTKRNRQLRQYDNFLEWEKRRSGYLEVIDSDSIRMELMGRFALERADWDELIIRFNEFHQAHEFLDWPKEKVQTALLDFIRLEKALD